MNFPFRGKVGQLSKRKRLLCWSIYRYYYKFVHATTVLSSRAASTILLNVLKTLINQQQQQWVENFLTFHVSGHYHACDHAMLVAMPC